MQKRFLFLILLLLCAVKPAAAAPQEMLAEDFSTVEQWAVSSGKAYISLCDDPQFVKTGEILSARLVFPQSSAGHEMEFVHENWRNGGFPVYTPGKYVNDIGLWVYGCGDSNVALNLQYVDGNGTFIQTDQLILNFTGWRFARFDAPDARFVYGIMLKSVEKKENPPRTVYIDALTVFHQDVVELPASTPDNPQTMQLGNTEYMSRLQGTQSGLVGQNGVGVTFLASSEVLHNDSTARWKVFSPQWVLDENSATKSSSALYTEAETENEWLEIVLPETEEIQQVTLIPAQYGHCFPIDYRIEISADGATWCQAAAVADCRVGSQTPQEHRFPPAQAKYVRIYSTKLKPEGNIFYAQFADILVYNTKNENVASYQNGAVAQASNPLNGTDFDYGEFYDDVFGLGVTWVNITNERAYTEYCAGKSTEPSATECANFQLLHDRQVRILYRFTNAPSYDEIAKNRDLATERYIAAIEPRVAALKDVVDVWGIFGEINAFEERRVYGRAAAENYAYVIAKVAERIRELDPDAKINIATALIDFTWTRDMLECGLANVVDVIGIHIYKEQPLAQTMPEMAGTFIENGYKKSAKEQPYTDYLQEYSAYAQLVERFNPNIEIMVTETSVQLGDSQRENAIQAKYLTRQYMIDKIAGAKGTFWFTVDPIQADSVVSTLVSTAGIRRPAWYALKNYAAVFSAAETNHTFTAQVDGNTNDLMYGVFETPTEYLVAYWYALPFRGEFTGGTVNIRLGVPDDTEITAVDLYTGAEQRVRITGGVVRDLVARDYVSVLRIPKAKQAESRLQIDSLDDCLANWKAAPAGVLTIEQNVKGTRLKEGKGSMTVCRTDAKTGEITRSLPLPELAGKIPAAVCMWVYCDGAGGQLSMTGIRDGKTVQGPAQDIAEGWQYMRFELPGINTLESISWQSTGGGALYIDDLRAAYQERPLVENTSLVGTDELWTFSVDIADGGACPALTMIIAEYDEAGRMTGAALETVQCKDKTAVFQCRRIQKHGKAFVLQDMNTLTPLAKAASAE